MMNLMTEAARDMPDEHVHVCVCVFDREMEYKNTRAHAHACTPVHQQKHLEAVCPIFPLVSQRSLCQ